LHPRFTQLYWSVRLGVRTPGFHPGNRGSIPLRATRFIIIMANHKSALKRIRRNEAVRLRNRYQHKTVRTAIKKLRSEENKDEAQKQLPSVFGMIDKLAKKNIIHHNKAANLKSKLAKKVAELA
jgi:small subunit ribosomal protein S20